MKVNQSQREAIEHKDGPMLVLAGPGSGKTTVITLRLKHMVEEYGINPGNILVITFTKAAATEMKERFLKLMEGSEAEGKSKGITFGTFHAVYFMILKHAYNYSASNIIKDEERFAIAKQAVSKYQIDYDDEKEFLSNVLGEISKVKSEGISADNYYSVNCPAETFREIYADYVSTLKHKRLIDFDDMLLYCYELLSQRSDILKAWQNKYKYILVDEFQDINRIQYDTLKLLAAPDNNLFIVGDDDQSIYGFRGSKPEIMLNFNKDFRNVKQVLLGVNYRSTAKIVQTAGKLIALNCNRYKKEITTTNVEGEAVEFITAKDFIEEYTQIASRIRTMVVDEGCAYSDFAVLYRTGSGIGSLVRKLMELNIPFKIKDSVPDIYEHWIAKDIFAYIRVALGNGNRSDFIQIMNKPKRYIGRDYLTDMDINLENLCKYYEEKPWMVERIEKLELDLKMLRTLNPYAAVNYIRRGIGYDEYLSEYSIQHHINMDELTDVINEILESARNYNTFAEWAEAIKEYKLEMAAPKKDVPQVMLTTMHSSKGLEFKYVFIVDANEGVCPHKKAVLDSDLEEERRMFYVAMTRAKQKLMIYATREKYNKKTETSRFVIEAGLCSRVRN